MRHKRFNEVLSYTYTIKRKSDGIQYHGVRVQNIKRGLSPISDFGVVYFTSGKLKKDFKKNPLSYVWKIRWTFDSPEEAVLHETKVNKKLYKRNTWANSYGKYIPVDSAKTGREKYYLIHFGVDHNSKIPLVVEKRKETFKKNYGVDNPTKSPIIIEKIKQTNIKRFGCWSGQNENIKIKIKKAFIDHYGVDNPLKSKEIQQKVVDTNLRKYGVEYTFQSKVVIDKIHQKRKDMYIRLAEMTDEKFKEYLNSISQHSAVQSQKKSQRTKGINLLSRKELEC